MNKLKTINKTFGAILTIVSMLFVFAAPAFADSYDYGDTGDYSSYDYTPSYDSGYSSYDYTPSYDSGYSSYDYTPSYDSGYSSYDYTPSYDSGYSSYDYTPSYDNGSAYEYPSYEDSGCGSSCGNSYSYNDGNSYDYTPSSYDSGYSSYDSGYNDYSSGCNSGCSYSQPQQQYSQPFVWHQPQGVVNSNQQNQNQNQSTGNVTNNNNNSNHVVINVPPTTTNPPVVNPPQNQQIQASCAANPIDGQVGDTVTWTVTYVTGGNGNYSYSWSGTDSLSGNSRNVYKSYNNSGNKSATVLITSGSQQYQANCQVNVREDHNNNNNDLQGSCYVSQSSANVGDTVTWSVQNVTGGNGNYSYSWDGTDNLYSTDRTVYKTYNNSGTKSATVRIRSSNGQEISRRCEVTIRQNGVLSSNITLSQNTLPTNGNLSSGVFLNQVPYTGAGFSMKMALFVTGIIIWSAFVAYLFISKRKTDFKRSKIEAFKRQNMLEKGMI